MKDKLTKYACIAYLLSHTHETRSLILLNTEESKKLVHKRKQQGLKDMLCLIIIYLIACVIMIKLA